MHSIYKNPFLSADKSIKMPSEVNNRTPGSLRQYSSESPAVMTRVMWGSVDTGEGSSFGTVTLSSLSKSHREFGDFSLLRYVNPRPSQQSEATSVCTISGINCVSFNDTAGLCNVAGRRQRRQLQLLQYLQTLRWKKIKHQGLTARRFSYLPATY